MLEEGRGAKRPMIDEALADKKLNPTKLAQLATTHALLAINLGLPSARDMIPRLLDIVHKYEKVIDTFLVHSKYTPVWMFLRCTISKRSSRRRACPLRPSTQSSAS